MHKHAAIVETRGGARMIRTIESASRPTRNRKNKCYNTHLYGSDERTTEVRPHHVGPAARAPINRAEKIRVNNVEETSV